jgi:hypothetical protein
MTRSASQFTIRGLQIVVLGAACVITLWLYADPLRYWRELAAVGFCPLMCGVMLLIVFGPRAGRLFGLGFVLGFVLEHAAMAYCVDQGLVRFSPTTLTPLGWYPLGIPIERFILLNGLVSTGVASVPATFAALLVSGTLCGALVVFIGEKVRNLTAVWRRDQMPAGGSDQNHGSRASVSSSRLV